MTRRLTVLITGATGLLGQGLCATAAANWSIVGVHVRPYAVDDPGVLHLQVDLRSKAAVEQLFAEHQFDAVIHTAGIASVDYSEQHFDESLASNLTGTRNLAELCAASGTRFIYVSTNAVFDGLHPPYRETDPVNPVNSYGRIKAACEGVVKETLDHHVIVRPILMYGWPHHMGRPNPVTWVLDALDRRETIHVVDDVYENPLYNIQAAQALWSILKRDMTGVVHLAGGEVVNRYELACVVARAFELDASHIHAVPSTYFPQIAPRPKNTTFVTARMESDLGLSPISLEEGLRLMTVRAPVRG